MMGNGYAFRAKFMSNYFRLLEGVMANELALEAGMMGDGMAFREKMMGSEFAKITEIVGDGLAMEVRK